MCDIHEKYPLNMEDMILFSLLLFNKEIDQDSLTSHSENSQVKHCMQIRCKAFVKQNSTIKYVRDFIKRVEFAYVTSLLKLLPAQSETWRD